MQSASVLKNEDFHLACSTNNTNRYSISDVGVLPK